MDEVRFERGGTAVYMRKKSAQEKPVTRGDFDEKPCYLEGVQ
jgi:hypothetical protein